MRGSLFLLLSVLLSACGEADQMVPFGDLSMSSAGDTLRLSHSPNQLSGGRMLRSDLEIPGLLFPTDVADLPDSTFAVLDRLDGSVRIFSRGEFEWRKIGGVGDGPGEYEEPYAIAGVGQYLVVWDKNARLTILSVDGRVRATVALGASDTRAIWQRVPLSDWEEPLQLSREDVTRRLHAIGDSLFGLTVQTDERFERALPSGQEFTLPVHTILFDLDGQIVDTVLSQEGVRRELYAPATERTYVMVRESPFAARPFWANGSGWMASGHGEDTTLVILIAGDTTTVTWPNDREEIDLSDVEAYRYWMSEGYRRSHGAEQADEILEWPPEAFVENDFFTDLRPQIGGILGEGSCLVLIGFDPDASPLSESRSLPILDVVRDTLVGVFRLPTDAHLLRSFHDDALWAITIEQDGTRTLKRYPLPGIDCGEA